VPALIGGLCLVYRRVHEQLTGGEASRSGAAAWAGTAPRSTWSVSPSHWSGWTTRSPMCSPTRPRSRSACSGRPTTQPGVPEAFAHSLL